MTTEASADTTVQFRADLLAPEKDYPQYRMLVCRDRYAGYFAGRGCGKTAVLVADAFRYARAFPGSTQILTEASWQMIKDILIPKISDFFGPRRGHDFHMTESPPINVTFTNGSQLWLRSTDVKERLYGMEVARVLMDEIAIEQQEGSYLILDGAIRQHGFPHQMKVAGTPKGRNWLWRKFVRDGLRHFTAETLDAEKAGFVEVGYADGLALQYGGWDSPLARQELGAAWVEMAGQGYPQFGRSTHVRTLAAMAHGTGNGHAAGQSESDVAGVEPLVGVASLKQRIAGIDFGSVSPTSLVACGLDGGGRVWAYNEWYRREASLDQLVEAMAKAKAEWGVTRFVADPSGKHEIAKLRNAGFRITPARHGNKFALRYQLVGARLNVDASNKLPGMYITPECPNLIRELETLSFRRQRIGGQFDEDVKDDWERGQDDHAWDSLANCLAEVDAVPPPPRRQKSPILFWER